MSRRRRNETMVWMLAPFLLGGMAGIARAQGAPPSTSVLSIGAGVGPTVGADPFDDVNDCGRHRSDFGSAAIDVGLRLSGWLSVEAAGARHFVSQPVMCPTILRAPRQTGADTLSSAGSSVYPNNVLRAVTLRLAATPFTWRRASTRVFAGFANVYPRGRSGPTIGASVVTGSRLQLRLELEHWFMPASRDVHDVFYMDGREVGRRERMERATAQPTFIRLGVHYGP